MAINILDFSNLSYTEQSTALILDSDISFTGGTNYQGGFVEFSISNSTSFDFLSLVNDGTASTVSGEISVVNGSVFIGTGATAAAIGSVDGTFDGQSGNSLRINFTTGFQNGGFESGSPGDTTIDQWTIVNQQVKFGIDQIAGLNTPVDQTIPTNATNGDQNTPQNPGTYQVVLDSNTNDGSATSARLTSSSITTQTGFDVVRGPYIYSDSTVALQVGDQVSFEWQAQGGGDAYDVYGYLVDVNTNGIITILDETGADDTAFTPWATEAVTVSQAGNYRFVFVAGTYDFTGFRAAGGQLFIDNVTVTQQVAPPSTISDVDITAIARKVLYENTSDNPVATKTVNASTQNGAGDTGNASATINITSVNDAPTDISLSNNNINEEVAANSLVGTLSSTDVDSANFTYSFVSGTGDADNAAFSIVGDELRINASPDFETKSSYNIRVQTDDGAGGVFEEAFTITINDITEPNNPPTDISLSNNTIDENITGNTPANSLIGTLSSTDVDSTTFTYSFVSGTGDTDNSAFSIVGNELRINNAPNFEIKSSYSIRVQTDDGEGGLYQEAFAININNVTLDPLPFVGYRYLFDYEQYLRFQNTEAVAPNDTMGGLPIAQLFDENGYLRKYADIREAVLSGQISSGYEHFVNSGIYEGRDPSVLFSEDFYLAQNKDVADAVAQGTIKSGIEHFLKVGHKEGRTPSSVFNQADYLTNNPDVAAAVGNGTLESAFQHYILAGANENRLPSLALFSEAYYLQANPDVAAAISQGDIADGFTHFVIAGQKEGRSPSAVYSNNSYLGQNADIGPAVANSSLISGFQHFEVAGRFEGRVA